MFVISNKSISLHFRFLDQRCARQEYYDSNDELRNVELNADQECVITDAG